MGLSQAIKGKEVKTVAADVGTRKRLERELG